MRWVLTSAALAILVATGCRCDEERPYTPFQVPPTALPSGDGSSPGAEAPSTEMTPRAFVPVDALRVAGDARQRFRLDDGVEFAAPQGLALDQILVADFDGDGKDELVAFALPTAETTSPAEGSLWLLRPGSPKPSRILKVPGFVPSGPGCTARARLRRTGPQTLTLDVEATCEATLLPGAPTRALSVVAPLARSPELLTLRLAAPAPGEKVDIDVVTTDRDADGRDDIELSVKLLKDREEAEVTARFVWIDRAAGLARDRTEPAKGFKDLGSVEVVRAAGKNTSRRVPDRIDSAIRLYGFVCAEGGVARLLDSEGSPIECGDLEQAFAWYAEAELIAALTRAEPREALGVLLRDGWFGPPWSAKTRDRLRGLFTEKYPPTPSDERRLGVRSQEPGSSPRRSPLRFGDDGALVVMTREGLARVEANGELTPSVEDEIDPWPLVPMDGEGVRFAGVAFPCDRSEVVMLLTSRIGTPLPSAPIGLLAPRPGACGKRGNDPELSESYPLVWETGRHEALVAGRAVRPLDQGAPEQPRGVVLPSALGLWVETVDAPTLWNVASPTELRDCVLAPGDRGVACVRGLSQVVVLTRR
jgi:hypothetical protein